MKVNKNLIIWSAILVILFVQVPHLAWVFADMSSLPEVWMQYTHGTLFAIAIDMCVLLFAIRGREWYTGTFMFISFIVTLQYYKGWLNFSGDWLLASSTVAIAFAGVLAIFFLSKEINRIDQEEAATRAEVEPNNVDGKVFTITEQEVIKMRTSKKTYDEIISHFKQKGETMSRDRILKIQNKFKSLYE